ncbi:MAG: bifunctional phosphoglucose/phosphomannose isomerase [Crenarchaeota archaeon]|nr:bifunctional phosphoglucose/phosphomannose isomerase [Thermoproteota archaeon]
MKPEVCSNSISVLDNVEAIRMIDKGNMGLMISSFPTLLKEAVTLSRNLALPREYRNIKEVVICGMGGSAIGGELFKDLSQSIIPLRVSVIRDYDLPRHVDESSLVVAVSYSGNTEETLESFKQAYERGSRMIAIASNGLLEKACSKLKIPFLGVPSGYTPRSALPLLFIPLLKVAEEIGFPLVGEGELAKAHRLVEEYNYKLTPENPLSRNPAKQLAARLNEKLPIIYSMGHLKSVALRYKDQINENAKMRAMCDQLPEANHNEVEAWEKIDFKELLHVVFIDSRFKNPYLAESINQLISAIEKEGVGLSMVKPLGETMLEEMLSAIILGDWVSYYLAILRGVDPAPVRLISDLKKKHDEKTRYSEKFEEWLGKSAKSN